MKFQTVDRHDRSKKRLVVAIILVIFLSGFIFLGFLKKVKINLINPLTFFERASEEAVTPLPASDPIAKLTTLISDKNINVDFPLIATQSGIIARLKDGGEVIFSTQEDFTPQIESLQIILTSLTIEGKRFKKIDLRYIRPIVVY